MVKLSDYNLIKDFSVLGIWCIEGQSLNEGVKGTLKYGSNSITLDLYDSFGDSFDHSYENLDYIYGFSQDGKLIVLKDCYLTKGSMNFPGFGVDSYTVNYFYLLESDLSDFSEESEFSDYFDTLFSNPKKEPLITTLKFSFNHIDKWINKTSVTKESDFGRKRGMIEFDLEKYKSNTYEISHKELLLTDSIIVNVPRSVHERSRYQIEEQHLLKISMKNEREELMGVLFQDANYIKKLIEFLIGIPLHFNYVEFLCNNMDTGNKTTGFNKPTKGRYFFRQKGNRIEKVPANILTLKMIEGDFEKILNNWFSKKESLSFIVNSYLNDLHLPFYVESKLLNSIRNLEIYYRNFIVDTIEEKKRDLEKDQQVLINFVKKELDEKNREHFIGNINFIGEESLQKKLKYLFKELPEPLLNNFVKKKDMSSLRSIKSLSNALVQTRNFYTHGYKPDLYPSRLEDPQEFFDINEKLKNIQRYFIYKELGLSQDIILKVLIPNSYAFQDTKPTES